MRLSLRTTLMILTGLVTQSLPAQLSVENNSENLLPIDEEACYFVSPNAAPLPDLKTLFLDGNIENTPQKASASLMYRPHLAFFCRVEVKIDEAVGTPFRFRLGSVDYVDYLEGKRRSY